MSKTYDDLYNLLNSLKIQADNNTNTIKEEMKKGMDDMNEKLEEVKKEACAKEKRDEMKMKGVEERLKTIEKKLKNAKDKCAEREELARKQLERVNEFKESVGLEKEIEPEKDKGKKPVLWSELLKEEQDAEKKRREKAKMEELRKTKTWKKEIYAKEREKETEDDREIEKKIEVEEKKKKLVDLKSKLKIGDDDSLHGEEDWSWGEMDEEWEGTEEKLTHEKRKKIERYRKRKQLVESTALKAKHMLGMGPIKEQSIAYFMDITADHVTAKEMAVREFMSEYLEFSEGEMMEHDIIETLISSRNDDIVYVTFAEHATIREIHARAADIKNDDINLRNYVPPQFWARYSFLSSYCKSLRDNNSDTKTMMRFTNTDIEVLTKDRTKQEGYKVLELQEIEAESGVIPKFQHQIKWNRRSDVPHRKKVTPVKGKVCPPSLRRRSSSPSAVTNPPKRQKNQDDDMEEDSPTE